MACAQSSGSDISSSPAAPPSLGAADGLDEADRDCAVILRRVVPAETGDGRPLVTCGDDGRCWRAFDVDIDLRTEWVAGRMATAMVLHRDPDNAEWFATPATAGDEGDTGYTRFRARLSEHTIRDGLSGGAFERAELVLIPYAALGGGARVFDHNVVTGDFDNYVVGSGDGFSFETSPDVCTGQSAAVECSPAMHEGGLGCIEEISDEWEYEAALYDVVTECLDSDALPVTFENACSSSGAPQWCEAGLEPMVEACGRELFARYPRSDDVFLRLSRLELDSLEDLEATARNSQGCSLSGARCDVRALAFRYEGEAPTMAELLSHGRGFSPAGSGTFAALSFDEGRRALEGLVRSFDDASFTAFQSVSAELGLDLDGAEYATGTSEELRYDYGTCRGDMVVTHDRTNQTVLTLLALTCYD